MKKLCIVLVCAVSALGFSVRTASAIPAFQKEFLAKYVDNSGNEAFIAEAKTVKCGICHSDPEDKKKRNSYGTELDALLDKKADAKDLPKIQKALDEVGAKKSDPSDDKSPTWAELFKSGKFPAK